jgi:5-methylcytosine-specific restriction endonuclease McrA
MDGAPGVTQVWEPTHLSLRHYEMPGSPAHNNLRGLAMEDAEIRCDLEFRVWARVIDTDELEFTCGLYFCDSFPAFVDEQFKRFFRDTAICTACNRPMKSLTFSKLRSNEDRRRKQLFIVCDCKNHIWRMRIPPYEDALLRMRRYQHNWRRLHRLKQARGSHTKSELLEIVSAQGGRCLYCDAEFSASRMWSKDHIVPLTLGGTEFAWNLVASCRSCNSRRGNIPFFTYCRLLSLRDYKRMVHRLKKRISLVHVRDMSNEDLADWYSGLTFDNSENESYYILRTQKRRRPVALLLTCSDKTVRRTARQLFRASNSWIASIVDTALARALASTTEEQGD